MLGLGLQLNKIVNRAGGFPPLASLLTFFSKQRDDTTVINKLDSSGNSDAYLTVDPAVDIIDLSKYDIVDGTGDDLGWKVVKFNTINGEETYRVIYTAETVEGVKGLNDIPKSGADNNGKYILANDIDLISISNWTKIGYGASEDDAFLGIFNGNGFDIYNLYISSNLASNAQEGLFGSTSGAIISNLGIKTGNVEYTGTTTLARTGALIGRSMDGTLVQNCYSEINVSGYTCVGGLVGINISSSNIFNSYSTGTASGNNYIGGLLGYNNSSTISNSYSTGFVSSTGFGGGLVTGDPSSITTNSYWDTQTSGQTSSDGGTGLTTAQMKDIDNYLPEWDFTNIWGIDSTINNGYPYLRNLEGEYVSPYGTLTKIVTVNITETDPDDPHSYIKMPSDIKIGGLSLFNKDDTTIYNSTCTTAEEYVSEDPYLWHVDELNTETILSYLNNDYKFTWFVKNTFTEGTYEPLTIKEIFAYSQKIEDADDLNKIKTYIGYNWS